MNLSELLNLGIVARLVGDGGLQLDAPKGSLTPELIARIRQSKPSLIAEIGWVREVGEHSELHLVCTNPMGEGDTPPLDTAPPIRASRWLLHFADREPMAVWFAPAVDHAEALTAYPEAVGTQPFTPTIRNTSAPITSEEEAAIRAWLVLIEETDPTTIAEVIVQCQRDADARGYFTGRAAAELPKPDPFLKTRDDAAPVAPQPRRAP